jgi:hypothetical protein
MAIAVGILACEQELSGIVSGVLGLGEGVPWQSTYRSNSRSDYPPRNDPEHERTEFSEKVEKRELYLQGGWLA